MVRNENRYDWADIAKGLGIFLMVWGHSGLPAPIHNWIHSFHMPFFFIISGFFFKQGKYTFKEYFLRKTKTILLPYVFFAICDYLIRNGCISMGLEVAPPRSIYEMFVLGKDIGAAWFLLSLFFTEVLFFFISKLSNNKIVCFIITSVLFSVSYYFYMTHMRFPYKIEIWGATLFYYNIGYLVAQTSLKKRVSENCFVGWKWQLLLVGMLVLDFFLANLIKPAINIRVNILGVHLPSILLVCLGSFLIFQLSHIIDEVDNLFVKLLKMFFKYIGEYSIVLIGFSQVILQILKSLLSYLSISVVMATAIRYTLLWVVMLLLIAVFKNYMPILIGKSKIKK